MNQSYNRERLLKEIIDTRFLRVRYVYSFKKKPKNLMYATCPQCLATGMEIHFKRYGDGNAECVYWAADTWTGLCSNKECLSFYYWIELTDEQSVRKVNEKLLEDLCNKELRSLT